MPVKKKVVKKKPKGLKYWITKMDTYFHKYIRLRDTDRDGYGTCYTCNVPLEYKKTQAGHFINRSLKATRWDETNVKIQCARCNNWMEGRQFEFSLKLGLKLSKALLAKSLMPWKVTEDEYAILVAYWKGKMEKEEAKKTW
jgi:5-methylcytosine-specific restriction endonuclease McrA